MGEGCLHIECSGAIGHDRERGGADLTRRPGKGQGVASLRVEVCASHDCAFGPDLWVKRRLLGCVLEEPGGLCALREFVPLCRLSGYVQSALGDVHDTVVGVDHAGLLCNGDLVSLRVMGRDGWLHNLQLRLLGCVLEEPGGLCALREFVPLCRLSGYVQSALGDVHDTVVGVDHAGLLCNGDLVSLRVMGRDGWLHNLQLRLLGCVLEEPRGLCALREGIPVCRLSSDSQTLLRDVHSTAVGVGDSLNVGHMHHIGGLVMGRSLRLDHHLLRLRIWFRGGLWFRRGFRLGGGLLGRIGLRFRIGRWGRVFFGLGGLVLRVASGLFLRVLLILVFRVAFLALVLCVAGDGVLAATLVGGLLVGVSDCRASRQGQSHHDSCRQCPAGCGWRLDGCHSGSLSLSDINGFAPDSRASTPSPIFINRMCVNPTPGRVG